MKKTNPNPFERPVYDSLDTILIGIGILLILYAMGYSVAHYQHLFGHKPY